VRRHGRRTKFHRCTNFASLTAPALRTSHIYEGLQTRTRRAVAELADSGPLAMPYVESAGGGMLPMISFHLSWAVE
jgi:hypothetical protein